MSGMNIANLDVKEETDSDSDFTQPSSFFNVALIIEDKQLYANKMCLHLWTKHFDTIFSKPTENDDCLSVIIEGATYEDVIELLKVLHPPCQPIRESTVISLLSMGHMFSMSQLKILCEDFLLKQEINFDLYELALKFNLSRLESKFIEHVYTVPVSSVLTKIEVTSLTNSDSLTYHLLERCDMLEKRVTLLSEQVDVLSEVSNKQKKQVSSLSTKVNKLDGETVVVYLKGGGFKCFTKLHLIDIILEEEVKTEFFSSKGCLWWVTLKASYNEKTNEKMLNIFLHAKPQFEFTSSWSSKSEISFTLEHINPVQYVKKGFTHNYSDKEPNRGYEDFISMKNLLKPGSGFLENNYLSFEFQIKNENPIIV